MGQCILHAIQCAHRQPYKHVQQSRCFGDRIGVWGGWLAGSRWLGWWLGVLVFQDGIEVRIEAIDAVMNERYDLGVSIFADGLRYQEFF